MSFVLSHLDATTRNLMLAEIDDDVSASRLYLSLRLSPQGVRLYEGLLRESARSHHPDWLATELQRQGCIVDQEQRKLKDGRIISAKTPSNAAQILADGEFNRFYARAVCMLAVGQGRKVRICRGKQVNDPRPESEAVIGQVFDPVSVVFDLRAASGLEAGLALHVGANSGLTLELDI